MGAAPGGAAVGLATAESVDDDADAAVESTSDFGAGAGALATGIGEAAAGAGAMGGTAVGVVLLGAAAFSLDTASLAPGAARKVAALELETLP